MIPGSPTWASGHHRNAIHGSVAQLLMILKTEKYYNSSILKSLCFKSFIED